MPPNFTRRMVKSERLAIGINAMTLDDARAKLDSKYEKGLQNKLMDLLRLYNLEANRSRMDRRKTDRVGWPDITFAVKGLACCWEVKAPGGHLRPEQAEIIPKLQAPPNGWRVWVIESVEQGVNALREVGGIP